jgi:hypothetical protein
LGATFWNSTTIAMYSETSLDFMTWVIAMRNASMARGGQVVAIVRRRRILVGPVSC